MSAGSTSALIPFRRFSMLYRAVDSCCASYHTYPPVTSARPTVYSIVILFWNTNAGRAAVSNTEFARGFWIWHGTLQLWLAPRFWIATPRCSVTTPRCSLTTRRCLVATASYSVRTRMCSIATMRCLVATAR